MNKPTELICGIDPGRYGGIVFLTPHGLIYEMVVMPESSKNLSAYLSDFLFHNDFPKIHFYLEKAQSMPGQGIVSTFNYGRHYGEIRGILDCLNQSYQEVAPQTWTKGFHLPYNHMTDPKKKSLAACSDIFDTEKFIQPRARKPHDGLVDAALIATWGRYKLINEGNRHGC